MSTNPLDKALLDPTFGAADVPFDPAGTGLAGDDVDAVLTELAGTRAFVDKLRGLVAAGDADHTFALADAGKLVTGAPATSRTFTVPTNASVAFPIPAVILIACRGPGAITVAGDDGVTVESILGFARLAGAGAQGALIKLATNTWGLYGRLSA